MRFKSLQPMTIVVILLIAPLSFVCRSQASLNKRYITVETPCAGIAIDIGEVSYSLEKEAVIEAGQIIIPDNSRVILRLMDQRLTPSRAFSVDDIRRIIRENPNIFESVIISSCKDASRIEDALHILIGQESLREFIFYRCNLSSEGMGVVAKSKGLRSLVFTRCVAVDSIAIGEILRDSEVRSLELGTNIGRAFYEISKMKRLESAVLNHISLNEADFADLERNDSIREIVIEDCITYHKDEMDVAWLMRATELREFTHLESLSILDTSWFGQYAFLREMPALRELKLCGTGLMGSDLSFLSDLKHLEQLNLSRQYELIGAGSAAYLPLLSLDRLTTITLDSAAVTPDVLRNFERNSISVVGVD
jgi:hypothetical protein